MSHRPPRAKDDAPGLIQAAGAICWRRTAGDPAGDPTALELLLVRSTRWGDWSWPKGKLEPGETLPECAVREVAEETGAQIELGVPLPSSHYVLPDGRPKTVRYWAARVRESSHRTALPEEISDVEWLPVAAALRRLTRPGDLAPVTELLSLAEQGLLDTHPLLILRHAKARGRSHWSGGEADRPLTGVGWHQALDVVGLLACWQPDRLLSSPWARCMQTLRPYLDERDKLNRNQPARPEVGHSEPEVLPLLSEQGLRNDPSRVTATIHDLLADPRGALVCTHRPVLAAVLAVLSANAVDSVRGQLPPADPWLAPAEILVAHVSRSSPGVTGRVQRVEQFRGESPHHSLR